LRCCGSEGASDIINEKTDEVLVKKHKKITKAVIKKMEQANIHAIPVSEEDIIGKATSGDIIDPKTKEVLIPINKELTAEDLESLVEKKVKSFEILFIDNLNVSPSLRNTLNVDKVVTKEDALIEIYRKLRPGDPPTIEFAETLIQNMFFSPERYDLSRVGRLKINHRLGIDVALDTTTSEGGYHRGGAPAPQVEGCPRTGRRYRPPRQQEGPHGGRTPREPVQDGPCAYGTCHQGEADLSRNGNAHAP
jgi:DNA-directed RNA polymerase subunit beta